MPTRNNTHANAMSARSHASPFGSNASPIACRPWIHTANLIPFFFSFPSFARITLFFPFFKKRMRRAGEDEEGQYPYQFSLTFAATGNPDDASYRWKYSVGAIVHPRLEGATVSFCECAELCASWPKGRCDGFYYNLDRYGCHVCCTPHLRAHPIHAHLCLAMVNCGLPLHNHLYW